VGAAVDVKNSWCVISGFGLYFEGDDRGTNGH
jgi:hypothetical protein